MFVFYQDEVKLEGDQLLAKKLLVMRTHSLGSGKSPWKDRLAPPTYFIDKLSHAYSIIDIADVRSLLLTHHQMFEVYL